MKSPEFLNFIGGQWIPAQGAQTFIKLNPFDGKSLGEAPASGPLDVIQALQHAKKAQTNYEKTDLLERAAFLRRIAHAIQENSSAIAQAEALHQGLAVSFVQKNSVLVAIDFFHRAADQCELFQDRQALAQPIGLVGIITSWCLSLRLVAERLAPALAAGNAALIKISELSPITGNLLGEVLEKAQCPPGLVQIIQGSGAEVGNVLAAHPSIRGISFAGRTDSAESIIRAASLNYKKLQLGLGAKNSVFVLADCDFKNKIPEILSSFLQGQGQMCWNSSRLFILESAREEFLEAMKNYLSKLLPASSPLDSSPWLPMINPEAVQHLGPREALAREERAHFVRPEKIASSSEGFFVTPQWTVDLTNCSVLQQDEVHGPLAILTSVKYQHEMVKWANTGYYGHSAVIWGSSEKARKLASQLQCSKVWINSWMGDSDPIQGHKQSSFGIMDFNPFGGFYSDVKKVTEPDLRQESGTSASAF